MGEQVYFRLPNSSSLQNDILFGTKIDKNSFLAAIFIRGYIREIGIAEVLMALGPHNVEKFL